MIRNELKIKKIKNGTVIDHLPASSSFYVLHVLGIGKGYPGTVSIAMNVSSKSSGKKDIVKVENRILKKAETDKLALIAPNATINIIKDYKVVKKNKVSIPDEIVGVIKCANPNCITNKNEPIVPSFKVESKNPIRLRCKFCERIMEKEAIEEQL